MHTKNDNRKQAVIPKQLQKQTLEGNHSGIMHVLIYRYKKILYHNYDSKSKLELCRAHTPCPHLH